MGYGSQQLSFYQTVNIATAIKAYSGKHQHSFTNRDTHYWSCVVVNVFVYNPMLALCAQYIPYNHISLFSSCDNKPFLRLYSHRCYSWVMWDVGYTCFCIGNRWDYNFSIPKAPSCNEFALWKYTNQLIESKESSVGCLESPNASLSVVSFRLLGGT